VYFIYKIGALEIATDTPVRVAEDAACDTILDRDGVKLTVTSIVLTLVSPRPESYSVPWRTGIHSGSYMVALIVDAVAPLTTTHGNAPRGIT
jgi:hypothetical protein